MASQVTILLPLAVQLQQLGPLGSVAALLSHTPNSAQLHASPVLPRLREDPRRGSVYFLPFLPGRCQESLHPNLTS